MPESDDLQPQPQNTSKQEEAGRESCPVCGGPLLHEKCKVVCRSNLCTYRIIYTCAEF